MKKNDFPIVMDLVIRSPPNEVKKLVTSMARELAWVQDGFQKRQVCLDEEQVKIADAKTYARAIMMK